VGAVPRIITGNSTLQQQSASTSGTYASFLLAVKSKSSLTGQPLLNHNSTVLPRLAASVRTGVTVNDRCGSEVARTIKKTKRHEEKTNKKRNRIANHVRKTRNATRGMRR